MNETLKRSISGVVYVILLIASLQFSVESFFVLFGIFLILAIYEFCNLMALKKILPILIGIAVYLLCYKIPFSRTNDQLLLAVTLIVSVKCIFFLFDDNKLTIDTASKYMYLIGYVLFPFILITKIPIGINGYDPKVIISIFILIWINDTFAYIIGKSIGKHKLFERISPKKTIEGFIGGLLFCLLASYFISVYYIGGALYIWIIIAAIVGVFGTIGDLIESKFKRVAGVKDSGTIMPGHGGVLDRLDSIIFVAPIIYLFYQILYYVS